MNEQDFQLCIDRARQAFCGEGGLWVAICEISGLSRDATVTCLTDWHAVAVLPDERWGSQAPQVLACSESTTLLQWEGKTYLWAEDPWSDDTMRRLEATGRADIQIALALPGQGIRLRSMLSAPQESKGPLVRKAESIRNSVVDFVEMAIARAYDEGASDVHFETSRAGVQVKYRLDGVMLAGESLNDSARSEEVISRIKVMAQLDITERRRPQDGRMRWTHDKGESIDLRVSIMPSIFGEDAVLRLLDKAQLRHEQSTISLDLLGFSPALVEKVRALASRPHGMLLVTGPTGSGKTTTVYAALSEVNNGLEKIVTIEDPVEYELPGVLQIPVNEQKGLTFATGLRSILRHDPDKILVGEIRDPETAQIAVQSALTGHLVFTTVHANSLLDVLGRFRHFGIEPFALASALNGVVVQRLLRRCCRHCVKWRDLSASETARLQENALPMLDKVPVAVGCSECRGSGYRGRFVLAEVHTLSDAVRDLMLAQDSMTAFKSLLYADGQQRLIYQAVVVVADGQTTLEELQRVVGLG